MGFEKNYGLVRKLGRYAVLPVNSIKQKVGGLLEGVDSVIDIGSGTKFWSNWFSGKVKRVYAVDVVYKSLEKATGQYRNIDEYNDANVAIDEVDDDRTMVWMCDVLHHLEPDFSASLINKAISKFDYIIIKDIDCHHVFGNFMNRMHDKLINHETVRDVDPEVLSDTLSQSGFEVERYSMPRLWYPHFLIIGKRI